MIYQQHADGSWQPAVPLPLYKQRWFGLFKRFVCECRAEFKRESEYVRHYRQIHHPPEVSDV